MGELREREKVRKVREWESLGKGRTQKHIQTTVFVSNLPPRLHWKGLWFAFARYGEVMDAFIPTKKSKTGFRYGFVRFLSLEDAERAILHLNGGVLYRNRLNASLARFSDNLEGRKSKQMKNNELRNRETGKNLNIHVGESSSDSRDTLRKPRLKRVLGHVDEEALKKLEKCLIGTMATVCSTSQVEDRLQAWGQNDVIVKYMGGCENASQSIDCEKITLLISTKQRGRINETSSEAVPSVLNVTSTEAIGPYIHVNHPVVSWADVVARHSPEQTSQGDRAGEVISRMHNQNGELDPITGLEGCEAHSRRIPTDKVMDREEFGICLSATKRNLKVEKPILSAGKLANCVNLELESLTLPLS
ncbi:hypothetical protein V6N13_072736 [Hibiscus sabdariffa]